VSHGHISTIVLAAGASSRLGQPKQLVLLDGVPLVTRAARTALEAGMGPVIVVLGADAEAVEKALVGLKVTCVRNARWGEGMGTSIAAGVSVARQDPTCDATILMTCDQPGVTTAHLRALARHFLDHAVSPVGSAYGGSAGIPALFARAQFPDLTALAPASGAKALLVQALAVPCAACVTDVDTPADLPPG